MSLTGNRLPPWMAAELLTRQDEQGQEVEYDEIDPRNNPYVGLLVGLCAGSLGGMAILVII